MDIRSMKDAINAAAINGKKTAMMHYQFLIHADELRGVNAKEFCADIGLQESYSTEFNKMISLAALMKEQGATIKIADY
jgi:hypothetical protein